MCDQEVMKRFIQEASRMEKEIEELCRASCNLPQPVTVLDTRVNFPEWRSMDRSRQASEVWRGQSLLSAAVSQVRSQRPAVEPFLGLLQIIESSLRSIRDILRGHRAQAAPQTLSSGGTLNVETVKKLFSVYTNFLRGKVDLYISGSCQGNRR
uniref:Erythropoietin n=1 Tax=Salvator merianae TaxID=96440 RepID=A0A8D0B4T9_SALMN